MVPRPESRRAADAAIDDTERMRATAPADVQWTAGAVARMLEVPASTLRSWHRRYPIRLVQDAPGRHRRYTTADVMALARMKQLITAGMAGDSAAELVFGSPTTTSPDAAQATVSMLVTAASSADAETVVALLDTAFSSYGVTPTWDLVCRPALRAVGDNDTEDSRVDIVHHLSWAITTALHRIRPGPLKAEPPLLLACVDGERHTLPLEVLHAALAEHGTPARMMGASVPAFALRDAVHRAAPPPAAVVLWAQADTDVRPYRTAVGKAELVPCGPGWTGNTHVPHDLTAALTLLTTSSA
jgi:DNA-binding transcriptional MerR regulator